MHTAPSYLVEVRDKNFNRLGHIADEYLDLMYTEVHRGIGSWQLKLPNEHALLPALQTPGSGIIITKRWLDDDGFKHTRVYSGRMKSAALSQSAEDPNGTWVIEGWDDGVVAAATQVLPDPAHEPDAQEAAYWTASGNGEAVMKDAVRKNAGDLALVSRRYTWLTTAPNLNRGGDVRASARFDVLGDLLSSLGTTAGLGWRFYQVGSGVTFEVYPVQDKTATIRLDVRNGGLESTELGMSSPGATTVFVLGQGEGEARTVLPVSTPESLGAAADWGLHWEQSKDQRNTNDADELQQAGEEILAESGTTVHNLKVTPSDAPGMMLGIDWDLGDTITVTIDGTPAEAVVTQVATSISSAGVLQQATVGDPVGYDWDARVTARIKNHERRVSDLEARVGTTASQGTTAARDERWGVPTTDAERVTLANQAPTWWNTEKSWMEGYFAPAGLSGLTARPLLAGRPAGWYPLYGKLPHVKILVPAVGGISGNQYRFRSGYWSNPPADQVDNITVDNTTGLLTLPIIGTYEVGWMVTQGTGSGWSLIIGAALNTTTGTGAPLGTTFGVNGVFAAVEVPSNPSNYTFNVAPAGIRVTTSAATDHISFWFNAGTGTTNIVGWSGSYPSMVNAQYLSLDYVSPPFMTR